MLSKKIRYEILVVVEHWEYFYELPEIVGNNMVCGGDSNKMEYYLMKYLQKSKLRKDNTIITVAPYYSLK